MWRPTAKQATSSTRGASTRRLAGCARDDRRRGRLRRLARCRIPKARRASSTLGAEIVECWRGDAEVFAPSLRRQPKPATGRHTILNRCAIRCWARPEKRNRWPHASSTDGAPRGRCAQGWDDKCCHWKGLMIAPSPMPRAWLDAPSGCAPPPRFGFVVSTWRRTAGSAFLARGTG